MIKILLGSAVASLTVPGGQDFHFPRIFLIFRSVFPIFPIFPRFFLIFFLLLVLRVGESPTREGPGYATAARVELSGPLIVIFLWAFDFMLKIIIFV